MLGLLIVVVAVVLAFVPELLVSDIGTANRGNIMVRLMTTTKTHQPSPQPISATL